MNAKFSGIIFIGTPTFGDIFKYALVYLYWGIKFPQQNINQSGARTGDKNLSVELIPIFLRKPITRTLIIYSVNALCIWDENTFIKKFYTNYPLFNWTWSFICFKLCSIVTDSNVHLFSYRRNRYPTTYQIYIISNT